MSDREDQQKADYDAELDRVLGVSEAALAPTRGWLRDRRDSKGKALSGELDLDAIEARAEKATEGPWGWVYYDGYRRLVALDRLSRISGAVIEPDDDDGDLLLRVGPGDAAFIEDARTDVPHLVAEIKRLQAENATLREALYECAAASGADVSDGAPTWPGLDVWALECVHELRQDYDATIGEKIAAEKSL